VNEDAAAQALLGEVVAEWRSGGPLDELSALVRQVWRTNLVRYEPSRLGDDAMSLGVQSSRNLGNLAVRRLSGTVGVQASNLRTLEVRYRGRVLHAGKVTSRSSSWDITSVDWSQSEVRTTSAEMNSRAYVSAAGTLFEGAELLAGQPADPRMLCQLQVMWQGFSDGSTRTWVGFPQLGTSPWFAVMLLDDDRGGSGGLPAADAVPVPPTPDFDALGEPVLKLTRRSARKSHPQQREA